MDKMVVEGHIEVSQAEPESHTEIQTQPPSLGTNEGASVTNADNANVDEEVDQGPKKRPRSVVWNSFVKLPKDQCKDGEPRAKCNHCSKIIKCDPVKGTSGMLRHLQKCGKNPNIEDKNKQSLLASVLQSNNKRLINNTFNQDEYRLLVAEFVILDEMSFRVVEGNGFKKLLTRMEPRFVIPSRKTVTRDCLRMHMQESIKLKRYFKKAKVRVSLTMDTWTSCQNSNYMCLTAHWIDEDWTYQKRILNFSIIENHKAETIATAMKKYLLAWNIENVCTITVDNASTNDKAVEELKDVLRHWNGLVCDGNFLHLRCCAHILNLIVSDGMKELHSSVEGIRNAVKYVRSSPSRLNKFKQFVEKIKLESKGLLIMDCPTRWNSIYHMLESAIKFSAVFERMIKDDEDYLPYFVEKKLVGPPVKLDFEMATEFVEFLREFYEMTLRFSGSLQITSNDCFHQIADLYVILKEAANNHTSLLCIMAQNMLVKFEKYWGNLADINPLLMIGVLLDPRYKMKFLECAFEAIFDEIEERERIVKVVLDVLYRLFDHYATGLAVSQSQTPNQGQAQASSFSNPSMGSTSTDSLMNKMRRRPIIRRFMVDSETEQAPPSDKYGEVDKYLKCDLVPLNEPGFDVLIWWRNNCSKYRVLSLITRDVLAIPVSTVSSESAFSTGGRVSEYRSSLAPKTVEALICTQNWLSPSTSSLHEQLKDLQLDDFNESLAIEQAESTCLSISEDQSLEAN